MSRVPTRRPTEKIAQPQSWRDDPLSALDEQAPPDEQTSHDSASPSQWRPPLQPALQAAPPCDEQPSSHAAAVAQLEHRLEEWMSEIKALIKSQGGLSLQSIPRRSLGRSRPMSVSSRVTELQRVRDAKRLSQEGIQTPHGSRRHQSAHGDEAPALAQEGGGPIGCPEQGPAEVGIAGGGRVQGQAGFGKAPTHSGDLPCPGEQSDPPASMRSSTPGRSKSEILRDRWETSRRQVAPMAPSSALAKQWAFGHCAVAVCSSWYFTNAIFVCVLLNTALLAAQVQHESVSDEPTNIFMRLDYCFLAIFTFEQIIKSLAFGCGLFRGSDRYWNTFDLLIVICSWAEVVIASMTAETVHGSGSAIVAKLLKLPRMARVLRLCRTVRFLLSLRVMVLMILRSFLSLFWVVMLLSGILFVFAILLTQNVTDYVRVASTELRDASAHSEMVECFGSLALTMYSLSQAMTGGRNWGEYARMLTPVGWDAVVLLMLFIYFTAFSVVNIVTGVFVDGAIEMAKTDRLTLVEKKARQAVEMAGLLVELLIEMDGDQNGSISLEEFLLALERPEVQDFLVALDIKADQASMLFHMLDSNDDGDVDIVEFVDGMTTLKGEAKSMDVQVLLIQVRKLLSMFGGQHNTLP